MSSSSHTTGLAFLHPLFEPFLSQLATAHVHVGKLRNTYDLASEGLLYVGSGTAQNLSNFPDGQNTRCILHISPSTCTPSESSSVTPES